jgi:hypothetical protein
MLHWVDVSTWRRAVLGRGAGKRREMKKLAILWTNDNRADVAGIVNEEEDLADAACICEYGKRVLQL